MFILYANDLHLRILWTISVQIASINILRDGFIIVLFVPFFPHKKYTFSELIKLILFSIIIGVVSIDRRKIQVASVASRRGGTWGKFPSNFAHPSVKYEYKLNGN
jgi:hypothetical protein